MPDAGLLRSLTLARGDLDRAAERRDDTAWLEQAWADAASRVLVLRRGRAATRRRDDGAVELVLVGPQEAAFDGVRLLLAVDDGAAFLAVLVDEDAPEGDVDGVRWGGLREVGAKLGDRDAGLLVMAVALSNWHATHPRCPRCGAATEPTQAGWSRTCPDDGSQHFPRNDPAVIVLITDDDDRALLGRRADWAEGWYSTLAGFVEAGESAEMAVVREMLEEAGVLVDLERLDYLGSQPWPFPSSLMLGYRARVAAASGESRPDGVEISELRWFTREEMLAGAEAGTVRIPPPLSIARRLIEHWYGEALPGTWSRP
jgi:NAD+ diphosphatase